jgi:sulfide:quinone oxidoreductase
MLLAKFDYAGKAALSLPMLDTQKERYDMYLLKRYGFVVDVLDLMLRGLA